MSRRILLAVMILLQLEIEKVSGHIGRFSQIVT